MVSPIKDFIFGNILCYFQSKLPMGPSFSLLFYRKFLQSFVIFLFIIPSLSSFPSIEIESQQEMAKIAECAHRKPSTKDKSFICDPHAILSPMERHKIRHLLMNRFLDKNADKNVCHLNNNNENHTISIPEFPMHSKGNFGCRHYHFPLAHSRPIFWSTVFP